MPVPGPRRAAMLALLVAIGVGATGACSSSGDAPPATTVPPRPGGVSRLGTSVPNPVAPVTGSPTTGGTAIISRFDVDSTVACSAGGTASLRADYETDGVRVRFTVDQELGAGDPPPSGTTTIELPCDGAAHTIVLTAYDPEGRPTLQARAVLADDGRG